MSALASSPWTSADLAAIAERVSALTGLSFPPSRAPDVEVAIREAMARAGAASPGDFLDALTSERASWDALIDAVTIRESYFFRDKEQLDAIIERVIPTITSLYGPSRPCRLWSAGCASGEEPYSLAMLLERAGIEPPPEIYATDISTAGLRRAAEGFYRRWSLRSTSPALAARYFHEEGDGFRLSSAIRGRVIFRRLNLASDAYPSIESGLTQMDLILCKNVLIYFDAATITNVARRLFAALARGGWLVTGLSDPILTHFAPFEAITTTTGILYRRPLRAEAASEAYAITAPASAGPGAPQSAGPKSATSPLTPTPTPTPTQTQTQTQTLTQTLSALSPSSPHDHEGSSVRASSAELSSAAQAKKAALEADEAAIAAMSIRAIANARGAAEAQKAAADAIERHPISAELRVLAASFLLELGRYHEAAAEARAALYLDRGLAFAHLLAAVAALRVDDRVGARRAYRNVVRLCASSPADAPVPFADGEVAGRLAAEAERELARLDAAIDVNGGAL